MAIDGRMREWRNRLFKRVSETVCTEWLFAAQGLLGLWFKNENKLKSYTLTSIIQNELSTLQIVVESSEPNEPDITLYLCVAFGEIKLGVKVLKRFINQSLNANLDKVIPGAASIAMDVEGDSVFCDFVFRDAWIAKTDVMARVLTDANTDDMFSDAISTTCQHVVIATLRNLLEESRLN